MWIRSARDSPACAGLAPSARVAGIIFESVGGEGIFLWDGSPMPLPVDDLVRRARDESILLARGSLFSPSQAAVSGYLNVAHSASAPLVRFLSDSLRIAA